MSIIVPLVLFLIIWILVIRPMDDVSNSSGLSGTEQRETHAAQETVQLPQPQMSGQESQPAPQDENGQAMSSPAPASPKQPEGLATLIPGQGTASVPRSQESTIQLLKHPHNKIWSRLLAKPKINRRLSSSKQDSHLGRRLKGYLNSPNSFTHHKSFHRADKRLLVGRFHHFRQFPVSHQVSQVKNSGDQYMLQRLGS
ncbi:hypothetical protein SEPCBS57363_004572 [Sporothrix epigloea]|uniref:Uncharacterized protein n=1 Tax=Sporothrix epigloea TaxID=1892477 RepID=A0ABP0DSQ0_9PEZI